MGPSLARSVGTVMDVRSRLAAAVLSSGVPLERRAVERAVSAIARSEAPLAPAEVLQRVVDDIVGLGPLEDLLADDAVTDVLVNGPEEVWVERRGALTLTDVTFDDVWP